MLGQQGALAGVGEGGTLVAPRRATRTSRVERPFPDMAESLEMVQLLRRATLKDTAVFKSPFQIACFYQAVTGSHETAIILPTGT